MAKKNIAKDHEKHLTVTAVDFDTCPERREMKMNEQITGWLLLCDQVEMVDVKREKGRLVKHKNNKASKRKA